MESKRVMCPHCDGWFFPEEGVSLDDCPVCGRTVEVKPAPAPGATCKESLQVHALPESEDVAEALAEISAAGLKGVAVGLRLHIKGLTLRLAEAEQEACEALAGAHAEQEVSRHWKQEAEYQNARVLELEAFKARVMEWAWGRCGACEHEGSEDDTCYNCQSDYEQSNWTPPSGWEDIA